MTDRDDRLMPEPAGRVTTLGLIGVLIFGALCLGFHWFGSEGWIPLLDHANLAIHEAGHPLIGILWQRAAVYGGTVFQLAFPVAFAWHFRRLGNPAGVAASLVWTGENLFNVARYMADARTQLLPLVGGGDHDWTEIFSRWHVLHLDGRIAGVTRGIGLLLIVATMVWIYRRWHTDARIRSRM